jgi:hypothetical protein
MKIRRLRTREPTLLSAIEKESGLICGLRDYRVRCLDKKHSAVAATSRAWRDGL